MLRSEIVAMIVSFSVLLIAIIAAHIIIEIRVNREMDRISSSYTQVLQNETELSLPKLLAVELVDALGCPEVSDLVIEIYKNREKDGWVDLYIRRHDESESSRMDNFIAIATDRNYGEIIVRHLL